MFMTSKDRIMLWGWYGYENLGDDLLLETMLKHLQGNVAVAMRKKYPWIKVNQVKRSYGQMALGAFRYAVVVIGPGGLFPVNREWKVFLYYLITRLWILMGKRVIFFGIGISEEMNDLCAFLWRRMAKTADLFAPRSELVLQRLGLQESETIHAMADCVFASGMRNKERIIENRVAISVANLQQVEGKLFWNVVDKWTRVVKELLRKGFCVDLIAFTKGDDDEMIDAILKNLKYMGGYKQYITGI